MQTENKIELQSFDFFRRMYDIHTHPTAGLDNIHDKYIHLKDILDQVCFEQTANSQISFANLFARLDYVCKEKGISPADNYAIQTMRRNCHEALNKEAKANLKEYLYDLRALARFVSSCYGEEIPAYLAHEIPSANRPFHENTRKRIPYVRVSVSGWTDSLIYANTDMKDTHSIIIDYIKGGYQGDMGYLKEILTVNAQLNLLDVQVDKDGHYLPKLIIFNPDYLIDISALSACFVEYGHHPYNYFLNRLKPRANTSHILMGNLAGKFLDGYINETADSPVEYASSIKSFFASSALEFCTCPIPSDFHSNAQSQMLNIRSFINEKMPHDIPAFDRKNTLLEASFICESLGLQGRVDMLQKDFKILVEQKAGKRDEFRRCSREAHYIQMMLYQEVLMHNFHLKEKDISAFLLYSKYADGLVLERSNNNIFRETMRLRNYIVACEAASGEGFVKQILDEISPDMLNAAGLTNRLWRDYQEPELTAAISRLKNCSPVEKAYFMRFYTFIMKELSLAKMGGGTDSSRGFASLWHTSVVEKKETGNILTDLKITEKTKSSPDKGYDVITLSIPEQKDDFIPNFRKGDMVILYAYTGTPDVRNSILMKGSIMSILPQQIILLLRNGQQNSDIIGTEDDIFAIEHDASDISASGAIKGLYAFLGAQQERRQLLLGLRSPQSNPSLHLAGDYGRFNDLILKEKQAVDYFLLVGPPGTGKTSCALRYMVEEALTDPGSSLLLLSYTNRAVDEICNMLVSSGIAETTPFIRIGNELSCDHRFAPYLLDKCLGTHLRLDSIRSRLMGTRIFVGTTTSISSRPYLFNIKHFSMAIIDEASQILEPDLIGILSAQTQGENAISKFVLIGDYKPLPAISQQNSNDAAVNDKLLIDLGITDCRNSLFERLSKRTSPQFRDILNRQGRMHPAISEFPNNTFYFHEHLDPVPLPHQEEEMPYSQPIPETDAIYRLLAQRRMIFIPAYAPQESSGSDKANANEAQVVAILVHHIYTITGESFDPDKTVGVIVPYRNQIAMIRSELQKLCIPEIMNISIDTVERYQGSQRDVIIYSFTIRNYHQLNFLSANTFSEDEFIIDRKLNVAITRARKQLILTGNPKLLGANLTFYKLMEYIRINKGYIETDSDHFCQGDFTIPSSGLDCCELESPEQNDSPFHSCFQEVIVQPLKADSQLSISNQSFIRNMEITAYGRWDHVTIPKGMSADQVTLLYNYYFMPRQYQAARSLYTLRGNWLRESISHASGRVLFCDLSFESGASALAFYDSCRDLPHFQITHVRIGHTPALNRTTQAFIAHPHYKGLSTASFTELSQVPAAFWNAHSVLPEFIVFNVSSLFDRTGPSQATRLARELQQIMNTYKLHHYAVIYRDDAGDCLNVHSYDTLCDHLDSNMQPLSQLMPEKVNYQFANDKHSYIYEIRSNR